MMLLAALVLAAALRIYHIGSVPLWTDELFSLSYPKIGLRMLWTDGLRIEETPPLYYSLVAGIEHLFGDSAAAIRAVSLVASLLTIWLAARLGGEVSGRRHTGALSALLLALLPLNIAYAQEARGYALQNLALTAAMLGFARFLRRPNDWRALAAYAVGASLAIYFHMTSVFAVAAFNGAALASAVGRGRMLDRAALGRWIAANALAAVSCLPLLPILLSPLVAANAQWMYWMPSLTRWDLEGLVGGVLAGPEIGSQAMLAAEILVPLLAALVLLPPWRPDRRMLTVLVLVPGLCLALMVASTALGRKVLLTRTLSWLLIPLAVILADVLARRPKIVGALVIAVLVGLSGLYVIRVDTIKEDWPGFLARIPDPGPEGLIVLAPFTSPAAAHLYGPSLPKPARLDAGGSGSAETDAIPRVFGTATITTSDVRAAIEAGRPVWLIYRRPEYRWMVDATATLPPPKRAIQDIPGSNPGIRAIGW